ncbi:hypothetical protein C493_02276 [Natronolimnohabitans innermongolicus JCM 12255]|uniref:Halobacterial output domain-containing protein n=1 Tax=Natronolimnohabitans innermongolicus JCM 12255 TaxID=1227499 RepID=L9XLW5_9EURY|nr:hypothetical protein C493_02276 [Natronolimnohabitans innermongolicus JCM 12255]
MRSTSTRGERDEIIVDVVQALAEADRLELEEVEYTLYEYINPAVLTELADHDGGNWQFTFEIADHDVTITSDGRLFVDGVLCRTDLALCRSTTQPAHG